MSVTALVVVNIFRITLDGQDERFCIHPRPYLHRQVWSALQFSSPIAFAMFESWGEKQVTVGALNIWGAGYALRRTTLLLALLILEHHGRSGQHAGGDFQIVQVFAAEILGEARIDAFAGDLDDAQHGRVLIEDRH